MSVCFSPFSIYRLYFFWGFHLAEVPWSCFLASFLSFILVDVAVGTDPSLLPHSNWLPSSHHCHFLITHNPLWASHTRGLLDHQTQMHKHKRSDAHKHNVAPTYTRGSIKQTHTHELVHLCTLTCTCTQRHTHIHFSNSGGLIAVPCYSPLL